MQGWQTSYLGLRDLPAELSEFELQAFFSFSHAERELIERRRSESLKLGLALQIGFALERPAAEQRASGAARVAAPPWPRVTSRRPIWFRCARCTPAGAPCSITSSKHASAWVSNG